MAVEGCSTSGYLPSRRTSICCNRCKRRRETRGPVGDTMWRSRFDSEPRSTFAQLRRNLAEKTLLDSQFQPSLFHCDRSEPSREDHVSKSFLFIQIGRRKKDVNQFAAVNFSQDY